MYIHKFFNSWGICRYNALHKIQQWWKIKILFVTFRSEVYFKTNRFQGLHNQKK